LGVVGPPTAAAAAAEPPVLGVAPVAGLAAAASATGVGSSTGDPSAKEEGPVRSTGPAGGSTRGEATAAAVASSWADARGVEPLPRRRACACICITSGDAVGPRTGVMTRTNSACAAWSTLMCAEISRCCWMRALTRCGTAAIKGDGAATDAAAAAAKEPAAGVGDDALMLAFSTLMRSGGAASARAAAREAAEGPNPCALAP
jgi:hypothetical protein